LMSGKTLAAEIAGIRPDVKILFASGYPDETLFNQGILDAGIAFLRKPFTPDSLTRKVREVLDSN
jgi:two-component system cell cycle sensor histidine kinase/response regulator CckA